MFGSECEEMMRSCKAIQPYVLLLTIRHAHARVLDDSQSSHLLALAILRCLPDPVDLYDGGAQCLDGAV